MQSEDLTALISARMAESAAPAPPGLEELVRYLAGWLSPDRAHVIEEALTADREAARTAARVDRELVRLRALDAFALEAAAGGESPEADVARAWRSLLAESARVSRDEREAALAGGWHRLRQGLEAGTTAALAVLAEASAALRELAAPRRGAPAFARGDESSMRCDLPAGWTATASMRARAGDLLIEWEVERAHTAIQPEIELSVALAAGGRDWTLLRVGSQPGRHTQLLPGAAVVLGIPDGEVPAHCISVTAGEPAVPPVREILVSPSGRVLLLAEPRWREGCLEFVLGLTEGGGPQSLRASLPGPGGEAQTLGLLPASGWRGGLLRASLPCPGFAGLEGDRAPAPLLALEGGP